MHVRAPGTRCSGTRAANINIVFFCRFFLFVPEIRWAASSQTVLASVFCVCGVRVLSPGGLALRSRARLPGGFKPGRPGRDRGCPVRSNPSRPGRPLANPGCSAQLVHPLASCEEQPGNGWEVCTRRSNPLESPNPPLGPRLPVYRSQTLLAGSSVQRKQPSGRRAGGASG